MSGPTQQDNPPTPPASAYFLADEPFPTVRTTLSILVDNEAGALARVVGDGEAPLYADLLAADSLAGLPEATVITCGLDVLSAEGMLYARLLGEADVPVTSMHVGGLIHGIWTLDGSGSRAAQFGLDVAGALKRAALDAQSLLAAEVAR